MSDSMDIAVASKAIIFVDPFYGHFSLGIQKEFSNKVPTAGAGVLNINPIIYINEKFWGTLSNDHKIGLLMHELLHIVLFHVINGQSLSDRECYNIAADMCVNQLFNKKYLPDGAVTIESFPDLQLPPNLSAEEYYQILQQKGSQSQDYKDLVDAMRNKLPTVCGHETWPGGDEAEDGNGEGYSAEQVGELLRRQIEHQIKETVEDHMNNDIGRIPGYLRDFVRSLYNKSKPAVNWKSVVRSFKSFCDKQEIKFTRQRINKRFPDMEAIFSKRLKRLLVGIDVSGSIDIKILNMFFDQIDHIKRTGTEIDVAEWDTRVHRVYKYDRHTFKNGYQMTGGGGTCAIDMMNYFNKSKLYNGLICFTDGYIGGEWTSRSKPTLWVVVPNGAVEFSYPGKKIRMN